MTGSEDLSETRNLVEEINMRTKQLPLTKQDSYANAIYNSATRAQQARKGIKKQGSYEAAVESGAKNQAAAKRTKQILQIRKQDSYTKAIGGSFEDDHSQTSENREPVNKMRKQVGLLFLNVFFGKLLFLIVLFTKSCIWKDNICIQNIFLSMHILLYLL